VSILSVNAQPTPVPPPFPALVCPLDRTSLVETTAGELRCADGHRYSSVLGIPRVLASGRNYADAFGAQWKKFRSTQLDSYSGTSISRERLRRCVGDELWRALQGHRPLEVLEAGCGAGRFTEVLLQLPSVSLTSTDLSAAVEPNQQNCPQSERHRIIQCDINAAPFLPRQYDLVICLGVIQHTRSPEQTIASLYQQVKPGGHLVIDHYTHSLARYTKFSMLLLRPFFKRLSPQRSMELTHKLTDAFFPVHRALRKRRGLQMLFSRLSPLTTYFHVLPQLSDRLQYEWAFLDTYDGLTDYYKRLRTARQLRRALAKLGAEAVWVARGGNGIEARAQRPLRSAEV
jgi:2-polyprenyl-3-methyl-5-hydroxy-6-metoxy-1,4-benzoquinol methylase